MSTRIVSISGVFLLALLSTMIEQVMAQQASGGMSGSRQSIKRGYVELPEGQMHYRTQGAAGPVVLLIPQIPRSSDEYSDIIPLLAKDFRVTAVDMLGFGDSDKPPRFYQIPDHARCVINFLDGLGIKKVNLMGHHSGGKIAVEVAATYPERVEKLVLSSLSHYYVHEEDQPMPERFQLMEVKADGSHLMRIWNEQSGGDLSKAIESANETPLDVRYQVTLEYLKAGPRGEEGHYASRHYSRIIDDRLKRLTLPILIFFGEQEMPDILSGRDSLLALIPHAKNLTIRGPRTDGNIMRRRPKDVAEVIRNFLLEP